ncbi:MAG: hypothetical protein CSA62_09575 [Planctomycetota bacterium]|nr:MAG: hypothetical protein CSA62_09575 [Planctomycetota bacterium]
MTINDASEQLRNLLRETQAGPGQPGSASKLQPGSGAEFLNLLEKMQRLRITGEKENSSTGLSEDAVQGIPIQSRMNTGNAAGEMADPLADLSDAVKRADEAHETAMDIKRRLEEAFRRAIRDA